MNPTNEIRKTSLCKCGKRADFIKDYWVTENKLMKEKSYDETISRSLESACGILRRRFCQSCFSRIAAKQRAFNKRLNFRLMLSVMLPFLLGTALSGVSYFVFKDKTALVTLIAMGAFTVLVPTTMRVLLSRSQKGRRRIEKGDFSDAKAIDRLMDSLNFGIDNPKYIKEMPSLDVVVDGDGRVNYDMERSGFYMRVLYDGKISLEPMRHRILYPFKDDAEYIKRTYTHAGLLDDNIRSGETKELTEKDFDIKDGELLRYSGLSVKVEIPCNVTKIGVQAFKKSKNCEVVVLPDSVNEIEKEAFVLCPATEINIPLGVKAIRPFTFYMSAIKEMVIPEGVEEIADNAFGECYSLERVVIPSTCKKIGEAAFKGCSALVEVELSEGLESITDYCFNGCTSLKKIDIPDGCLELGNFAFEGCSALTEVYIPDTLQFIGGRVFEGATKMSIVGKKGSYADKFAEEYRLRFTAVAESRFKKQHGAKRM